MSPAAEAFAALRDYVARSTHNSATDAANQAARTALDDLTDHTEWLTKGNEEWRQMYVEEARRAKAARATAQIAINHLQELASQTAPVASGRRWQAARQWLASIGSEPT